MSSCRDLEIQRLKMGNTEDFMESQNLVTLCCDKRDCEETKVINWGGEYMPPWRCEEHENN